MQISLLDGFKSYDSISCFQARQQLLVGEMNSPAAWFTRIELKRAESTRKQLWMLLGEAVRAIPVDKYRADPVLSAIWLEWLDLTRYNLLRQQYQLHQVV